MLLVKDQPNQFVGINATLPTGYVTVKADGVVVAGAGAITVATATSGYKIQLTAADVDTTGPLAIIAVDAGGAACGIVNADVDDSLNLLAASQFVAAIAPAATDGLVVKANGTTTVPIQPVAVPGATNAFKIELVAADRNIFGAVSVIFTDVAGLALATAHEYIFDPSVGTTVGTYTLTITPDIGTPTTLTVRADNVAAIRALVLATRTPGNFTLTAARTTTITATPVAAVVASANVARICNDQRGF